MSKILSNASKCALEALQLYFRPLAQIASWRRAAGQMNERSNQTETRSMDRTGQDVEQQIRTLEEINNTDSLTGLRSRRWLVEQSEALLLKAKRDSKKFALLVLDFDRFKVINDTS